MICNVPLTPEQKQRSQFNYCCYCGINGISYMCLGETVMVLLAVRLALPDWAVAAISAGVARDSATRTGAHGITAATPASSRGMSA